MDLIVEDESRIGTIYFSQSEDIVRRAIALPWVSFCSDAASLAPEGVFLKRNPHPRAYGSFARLLGRYVRDERLIPLEEAIRKLTSLPAGNLRIDRRGSLKEGFFADLVVFDPNTIEDHATFVSPHQYATGMVHVFVNGVQSPHQYATGMVHVFVNGVQVLASREHTGATPGRAVRGPGWVEK
jgi:N-acyl-D-amino-acid deacylase